jgi:hypothetical protein
MAIALVQSNSGTSASATVNPSFSVAPSNGNLVVLCFASDDYNGTPNTGWTQSSEMEQQVNHGGYIWWRISTGANPPGSYTIGSATNSAWIMMEFSGVDASPYDVSEGQSANFPGSANYSTPSATPTSGNRLLVAMIGAGTSSGSMAGFTTSGWTNSFTKVTDSGSAGAGTNDAVSTAYRLVTANGSTAYSTTATWSSGPQSSSGLIIAFKEAAAGGGTTLAANSGSYALTGTNAVLARIGILDQGSYTLTGFAAVFFAPVVLTAAGGSYTLTGTAAGLNVTTNLVFAATAGSYTLTGSDATFAIASGSFTLFCGSGSYTLTGANASFPGYEPITPPVQPSTGGSGYAGAWSGPKRRKRKRDEIEELIDAIQAPVPSETNGPFVSLSPPPPALIDLTPKMQAAGLTPPQRKIVKRAIVTDDPDDDDEAIELLLNLLS